MKKKNKKTLCRFAAGISTLSLLLTGSQQSYSKAAITPKHSVATTTFTQSTKTTNPPKETATYLPQNTVLSNASATPASNAAISTPEPTAYETPSTNIITISDILSLTKTKIMVSPGNTYYVTYNASANPAVKSSNKKIAVATLQKRKLKITVPANAEKGSQTKVTLTLGQRKKTLTVQVYNKTQKINFTKKQMNFKKRKTKKFTVKYLCENKKKHTTDTIRVLSKKKSVLQIKKVTTANGKITISAIGKKQGKSTMQIQIGKCKKNVTCIVK